MITGILSCMGYTSSLGSVVMIVNVNNSAPALRSFHFSHKPARA